MPTQKPDPRPLQRIHDKLVESPRLPFQCALPWPPANRPAHRRSSSPCAGPPGIAIHPTRPVLAASSSRAPRNQNRSGYKRQLVIFLQEQNDPVLEHNSLGCCGLKSCSFGWNLLPRLALLCQQAGRAANAPEERKPAQSREDTLHTVHCPLTTVHCSLTTDTRQALHCAPPLFVELPAELPCRSRSGAIAGHKHLVRHAPNIRLAHLVHLVQLLEKFAPVAIARLYCASELASPWLSASPRSRSRAPGLVHLQLIVGHIRRLQLVNLFMDRVAHLVWRVPAAYRIKREQARILIARERLNPCAAAAICCCSTRLRYSRETRHST